MLKRVLLSVLMAAPLAGCLSLGADPPDQLLTLTPERGAAAGFATTGPATAALAVAGALASLRLNVTRVPVQASDSSLADLEDAVLVERPARLFHNLLAEAVCAG